MVKFELDSGKTVVVSANYDSGTFTGISAVVVGDGWCDATTLDELLSRKQIEALTCILGISIKSFIDEGKS
jgi:hypothetical protein